MNNIDASNNSINLHNFPMWDNVTRDATFNILSFMNPACISKCGRVCKQWNQFFKSEGMWQQLSRMHFPTIPLRKIKSLQGYFSLHSSFSRKMQYCVSDLPGHTAKIHALVLAEEDDILFSCSRDKTIKVWDLETKTCLATLPHESEVLSLARAENGILFSGCENHTLWAWDWKTNTCSAFPTEHTGKVNALALAKNGPLFSGSDDNTIRVWDTGTRSCTAVLKGHTSAVHLLAVTENGTRLFSGSLDKTVKVWDLSTKACINTFGHMGVANSFAVAQDGTLLVGTQGGIRCCPDRMDHLMLGIDTGSAPIYSLALAKTRMLFLGQKSSLIGFSKGIPVWNLSTRDCTAVIVEDINGACPFVTAGGSELIGCSASDETTIKICDFVATPFEILTEIASALGVSSPVLWKEDRMRGYAMHRFERLDQRIKNKIFGELYEIIKPLLERDYWGCGQDAFYGYNGQTKATHAQIALAIRNYLKNNPVQEK
jgi:hypothetical protein